MIKRPSFLITRFTSCKNNSCNSSEICSIVSNDITASNSSSAKGNCATDAT